MTPVYGCFVRPIPRREARPGSGVAIREIGVFAVNEAFAPVLSPLDRRKPAPTHS